MPSFKKRIFFFLLKGLYGDWSKHVCLVGGYDAYMCHIGFTCPKISDVMHSQCVLIGFDIWTSNSCLWQLSFSISRTKRK